MLESKKEFVLVYGDAFVDFIANDTTNTSFTKFLGGATVNVAAGISRIGAPSALITVTGDDETSEFVRNELDKEGVNMNYAKIVPEKRVSGVHVHLTEGNDRIFTNYIDETPDLQVETEHLQEEAFKRASIFNFCSNTMFHPIALETTRAAVKLAKKHSVLLTMDANIRPLRWESPKACQDTINTFLQDVSMLKLADEEMFFLTETTTIEEGIAALAQFNIPLMMITVGAKGTYVVLDGEVKHVPSISITCVDTTGAGDAFMAGILRHTHLYGMPKTMEDAYKCVYFANQLGAMAATKAGAITAMPNYEDIQSLIKEGV
ncbi:carbohydrate kinase [Viridibacillus sp. YIM B01967]|uniref:Carbohydrate kinase n=1 Tax=Viridibacillus soli TaxID=2798301 RepID=A0ABS1HDA2_9BACL|nr:carbohydrate kinase [Viridibacillus soli]MBK3497439.1 carbohydrate kinase [Viridibacillus soli]